MDRILLLEDDESLITGLSFALKGQGYALDAARTVAQASALCAENRYDLLILDVALPDGTGFEVCESVRRTSDVPILFLTASDEEISVIMGLDMGADDYITKPFKLGVLLSRIHALLRRAKGFAPSGVRLCSGGITVDLAQAKVYREGEPLEVTAAEYRLLCLLMQNPGATLPKQRILERLWDTKGRFVDENTLSVYIRRLRVKIEENPSEPRLIKTVRGIGYRWNGVL